MKWPRGESFFSYVAGVALVVLTNHGVGVWTLTAHLHLTPQEGFVVGGDLRVNCKGLFSVMV